MVNHRLGKPRHQLLRAARRAARIEQYELAAILGIDPGSLSKYETGQADRLPRGLTTEDYLDAVARASAIDFQQLADTLGVSLRELESVRVRHHADYLAALRLLAAFPRAAALPARNPRRRRTAARAAKEPAA